MHWSGLKPEESVLDLNDQGIPFGDWMFFPQQHPFSL